MEKVGASGDGVLRIYVFVVLIIINTLYINGNTQLKVIILKHRSRSIHILTNAHT